MPAIEALADEFGDRARFVKVNVDRSKATLGAFGAEGVPAYLVFRDGVEVGRLRAAFLGWFFEARVRRLVERALE